MGYNTGDEWGSPGKGRGAEEKEGGMILHQHDRLTRRAQRLLGKQAVVVVALGDASGRYLLSEGRLPLASLGWTCKEAERALAEAARLRDSTIVW
jgi:hypothetical protein